MVKVKEKYKSTGKFVGGLDIGQQNDYTVLSILEVMVSSDRSYIYVLRRLEKFPLRLNYQDVVDLIETMIKDNRMGGNCVLVADYTGVGRPVVDLFRKKGIKLVAVTITGGTNPKWITRYEVNVPKKDILFSLQVVLQNGNIIIPSKLHAIEDLKLEFFGFKMKITGGAKTKYEAATEKTHDDIVISLGIATWYCENVIIGKKSPKIVTGT